MMISVSRPGAPSPGLVGVVDHEVLVLLLPVRGLRVPLELLVFGGAGPLPPLLLPLPRRLLLPRAQGASLKRD